MKIYSWNILFRNKELDRAFEFIAKSDFDIFCLQEVPEDFLKRLQSLPYALAFCIDTEKIFSSGSRPIYHVILSRYPINATREIPFANSTQPLSLRARLFTYLMRPFHFAFVRNRGALSVDININGKLMRVFSLHLALTHPAERLQEFERAMLLRDPTVPTIVCGDFNILEKAHIAPLNWLLGGRVRDTLLFTRERTRIEKHFFEHTLTNALRGKITHSLSRSQLDHILVSRSFSVTYAEVLPDRIGSDHHPIRVEVS